MKKLLILGSGGMLGHVVYHYLKSLKKYDVYDVSNRVQVNPESTVIDITNKAEIESFIIKTKPDMVVNCIGVLLKGSNADPSNAIYINSYFPHQLSKLLDKQGGKLIHVSTDCVFSGKKGAYMESDIKDATDTYGMSKALGEVENAKDLTIRTSIIGPELKDVGEGLFHWYMSQTGTINGFTKMLWGGVTTLELAKVIEASMEQNLSGLINITNGQAISKYELVSLFKKIYKTDHISINAVEGKVADKSLKSLRTDFNFMVSSYEQMLQEQKEWMESHPILYANNYELSH